MALLRRATAKLPRPCENTVIPLTSEPERKLENTPHGSVGIVQVRPTRQTGRRSSFPLLLSPRAARGKKQRKREFGRAPRCRLGLKHPPTSVGGIREAVDVWASTCGV